MHKSATKLLIFVFASIISISLFAQNDEMKSDIGVTRGRDKHLWPIFFRETTEDYKKIEAAANLYAYYKYFSDTALHTHTLPLYAYDSSKTGLQLKIGTSFYPSLYVYQNSYQENFKSYRFLELLPHINAIEYARSPNGDYLKNNLLFFLWYKNDKVNAKSHLVLFPLYWNYQNTQEKTVVLLPLFLKNKNQQANFSSTQSAYTPFIWLNQKYSENTKEKKLRILPLFHQEESLKINSTPGSISKLIYHKNYQCYPLVWRSIQEEISHQDAQQIFNTQDNLTHLNDSLNSVKTSNKDLFIFPVFGIHNKQTKELWEFKNHFAPFYFYNASRLSNNYEHNNEINIGITPLIWHNKSNHIQYKPSVYKGKTYFQKTLASQTTKNWFIPFIFIKTKNNTYYSKKDSFSYLNQRAFVLPIYWKTSDTKIDSLGKTIYNSHTGVLPFVIKGQKNINQLKYKALSPFYWKITKPNSHFSMFLPSYFHSYKKSYSSSSNSYFLLPVWHHRFAVDTLQGNQINKIEISHSYTLFPLFHKTTLTYKYPDSVKQVYYLNAVTPILWRLKKEGIDIQSIFPLYWNVNVNNTQYTKQSKWFIPIYYSYYKQDKKDPKNNYAITKNKLIFPFYNNYFHQTYYADSLHFAHSSLLVFPVYFKNKINENQRVLTAYTPLVWHNKSNHLESFRIVPIFLLKNINSENQQQFTVKLWPLYTYHTSINYTKQDTNYLVDHSLFPVFFHQKESRYSMSNISYLKNQFLLFPLYLNYTETRLGSDRNLSAITPLYWHNKDSTKNNILLFPFYFGLNQNQYASKTLFPLFSYGNSSPERLKNHLVISPLFWHINNTEKKSTLLLPIYRHTQNKTSGINKLNVGLWLFNHAYNDSFYQSSITWPIIGWGQSKLTRNFHIAPLIWHVKDSTKNNTILFPIYFGLNQNNYRSKTVFPLFSYGKSSLQLNEKHLTITPLFWHVNNSENKSTLLLPLYIHTQNKWSGINKLNVGLWLFHHAYNDSFYQSNVLWPLVGWGKSKEEKNFHITPLVWYKRSDSLSYQVLFPIYIQYQNNYYKFHYVAWPLYKDIEVFNTYKKKSFLAGLYKKTIYNNGDYESRVLHLLFVNNSVENRKLRVLFPFYYIHIYANGGYSKSYAFAFYNQLKKKIPGTDEFYKELRLFWFIRYKSNYDYLLGKGIKFDRKKLK